MATVVRGISFNTTKEKFKIVGELQKEMKKKQFRNKIEVDNDRNIIICYFNDNVKIHI